MEDEEDFGWMINDYIRDKEYYDRYSEAEEDYPDDEEY